VPFAILVFLVGLDLTYIGPLLIELQLDVLPFWPGFTVELVY
jgi:hypothetical protein